MNTYQFGMIYKLQSSMTDKIYIGSTTHGYNRFKTHKSSYIKKQIYRKAFELLQYPDCDMILLENYPCKDKSELLLRELYWLNKCGNPLNQYLPIRIKGLAP